MADIDFKILLPMLPGNVHVLFKCLDVDSGDGQKTIELEELSFGCRAALFHCRGSVFQEKCGGLWGVEFRSCSCAEGLQAVSDKQGFTEL